MNMQALMAQARKMQGELERTTKQIEETLFNYENDNISIEAKGNNHIEKIIIKNKDLLDDEEILADIVTVAVNEILKKIKAEKENKLGKYAGGLGGLF